MTAPATGSGSSVHPVAVVTGGRQGLGLSTARNLADRGFDIVIVDSQPASSTVDEIRSDLASRGARMEYIWGDIATVENRVDLVDQLWAAFGRVDCLVDNAGIAARPLIDVLDLPVEAFDRSVEVNLRGTFFLTQEVARRMVQSEVSSLRTIIVVTSIAAEMASVERAQYSMTKAALSMMVRILAVRLASAGIAVHEVRPGFIRTAMTASADTSVIEEWVQSGRVPAKRWGNSEDVGKTIASIAAGEIPYMTGQPIWVAGGLNIHQAP